MRILLADDTDINRHYLGESFRALGHEVLLAVDGQQALDLAQKERCDLLILDVRMPRLFGNDVLVRLRASAGAASQHVPALAISSELDPVLRSRLLQDGFLAALDKPVRAPELLDVAAGLGIEVHRPGGQDALDPGAPVPDLDDSVALRALGRLDAVQQVRGMLLVELRERIPRLALAVLAEESGVVREWIHQVRASCLLCGAMRLHQTLLELRAAVLGGDWKAAGLRLAGIEDAHRTLHRLMASN